MKALIQRVIKGKVKIRGKIIGEIGKGYVIFFAAKEGDSKKEADILAEKTVNLRIMGDREGKMNLAINEVDGEVLVISQFTLYADLKGCRRPSFMKAAKPNIASELYDYYVTRLKSLNVKKVAEGIFGEYMEVELINDGPVTIMLDTDEL